MTIILSFLNRDNIVQVSDRRLTTPEGRLFDDESNKAIFYNGHFSIAYTGLASLDGKKSTLDWATGILLDISQKKIKDAIYEFSDALSEAIKKTRIPNNLRRLAFVAAGWVQSKESNKSIPMYISISNFQDEKGNWTDFIHDKFSVVAIPLEESAEFRIFVAGQSLPKKMQNEISRNCNEAIKRGVGPNDLARLLAITIRKISAQNAAVGNSIMISSIPRCAAETGSLLYLSGGPLSKETAMFANIPSHSESLMRYGPNVVHRGALFGGITIELRK